MVASASRSGSAAARRLRAALERHGIASGASPASREELDACEVLVALYDRKAAAAGFLNQELGYALARNVPLLLAADASVPAVGLLAGVPALPWPRRGAETRALADAVRRALPATPRSAARSLARASPARWSRAIQEEAEAELLAAAWTAVTDARQGAHAIFAERAPTVALWRKKVVGAWTYLRLRVAPFDPVDVARVRTRHATRVFEWWILPDARSDAWMTRVYGGEVQPMTARTKFSGTLAPGLPSPTRATALIARRFVTERVDRTGELAPELRAIEAWLQPRRDAGDTPPFLAPVPQRPRA